MQAVCWRCTPMLYAYCVMRTWLSPILGVIRTGLHIAQLLLRREALGGGPAASRGCMQSPTRQAKSHQAEQGATLPMAVKLAMVLSLVLGAAVTLRWSWDPPKFVLVRPFQVCSHTSECRRADLAVGSKCRIPQF